MSEDAETPSPIELPFEIRNQVESVGRVGRNPSIEKCSQGSSSSPTLRKISEELAQSVAI